MHLHPDYYGIRSKAAEIDNSVLIDRPEPGVFMEQWRSRLGLGERLWNLTLSEVQAVSLKARGILEFSHYKPTMYQGRLSGASLAIAEQ